MTWYLFRIPVRQFESKLNIDGFKSMEYARMILTDFAEPVVLRMANFRMVGSRWRRYTDNLRDAGLIPDPELTPITLQLTSLTWKKCRCLQRQVALRDSTWCRA